MGEVIPFSNHQEDNEKIGFHELNAIKLNFSNLFEQTIDASRQLNSQRSISSVKTEVSQIENKIIDAVNGIDGLRPGMPAVEEFRAVVWETLCLPLQYGTDRAAMDYYGTEPAFHSVVQSYKAKLLELQNNAVDSM